MRVPPTQENSVLVVVDVQPGFVSAASAAAVPVIAGLLGRWLGAGGRALVTRFVNREGSPYTDVIGWSELMPGDPASELVPEVEALAGRAWLVVEKTSYSALSPGGRLERDLPAGRWRSQPAVKGMPVPRDYVPDALFADGVQHVFVAGLDTESCVLQTAVDAFEHGFTPWVVTDAVAAHAGAEAHAAGLLVMGRNIGRRQLVESSALPVDIAVADVPR